MINDTNKIMEGDEEGFDFEMKHQGENDFDEIQDIDNIGKNEQKVVEKEESDESSEEVSSKDDSSHSVADFNSEDSDHLPLNVFEDNDGDRFKELSSFFEGTKLKK